ncbi:transketolase subunit A [Caldanaerovirga acetigignens]|uniref:Transketolase subunit A n=1 Tax=Caldanaerovirga acetigignens TaxID=447595 RepID=A0A1M7HAH0_9FIRM|nr:transketolase [Caldanaerovirga acetigignens]SHM25435.1 transketolase subunit A [Caldanaerovirga acetigignens]
MLKKEELVYLKEMAKKIRCHIIEMIAEAGSGHPGGSLSCTDILVALYFHEMRIDPSNPNWQDRDRFVLSKGHAAPALYAVLAERGYFPMEELKTLRKTGSMLQGHPDMKKTPGVDMTTGSLGQGLSAANGMAIAGKLDGKDYRVYVLLGDGELEEGQVWEAAMAAAHYKLDNLTAFVDHNGLQIDGPITDVMSPEIIQEKFKAFGWHVIEINGHDFEDIISAIKQAKKIKGKPTVIVANTVKGKGVPYMENKVDWHGKAPTKEQAQEALKALRG